MGECDRVARALDLDDRRDAGVAELPRDKMAVKGVRQPFAVGFDAAHLRGDGEQRGGVSWGVEMQSGWMQRT